MIWDTFTNEDEFDLDAQFLCHQQQQDSKALVTVHTCGVNCTESSRVA